MRGSQIRLVPSAKTGSFTESAPSRKRVRRACDECRLHKARCDGRQVCETCVRHNRECSYVLLPTECKGSAARIRILERRLTRAREHIQSLQPPKAISLNVHEIDISQEELRFPTAYNTVAVEHTFTAVGTGFGLIEALLSPLVHHQDMKDLLNSDSIRKILCSSTEDVVHFHRQIPFCGLPPYDTMLQIAHVAFGNIFGLSGVISERCFHAAAQKLYDVSLVAHTHEGAQFLPLFCGIMTLGILCQPEIDLTHHDDLNESLHYFKTFASSVDNKKVYSSISELQVNLTLVLYFVNTSKLDLARCLLQSITSSSIFCTISQAGNTSVCSAAQSTQVKSTKDIFWVIVYLDMHISNFLGVAMQLACPKSTIHIINTALRNVTIYNRSDCDFLLSVSLAIAIECLRLIQCMTHTVTVAAEPSEPSPHGAVISTNSRRGTDLEVELGTLESAFRRIFPDDDANPQISLARNELLMYFRISHIMLHHKSLLHHSDSLPTNDPQHVNNIQKGRACVMAASNAIASVSKRMESLQTTILSWLSAYTIFLSTITLLVATVSLESKDIYMQCTVEHTVRVAFQILKYATYGAGQKRLPYMNFLLAICARTDAKFEAVLRNDVSIASITDHSSCKSESSRMSSYPDPSTPFVKSEYNSSRSQWRSPTTLAESPEEWGFD